VILDNLLAQRKAVPMIIVMPNGYPSNVGDGGSDRGVETTGKELMNEVIPLIERNYRAMNGRESRAIAGVSMGGSQAFLTGLRNLDEFAWVAEFSSGVIADVDFRLEKAVPGFLEDPAAANKRLRLLFLSCGTEDPRYAGHLDLLDTLKQHGIRHEWHSSSGAHEWKVWRHSLAELVQKLFQPMKG
jgi:enterochelin esterase-like enzyme